MEIKTFSTKKKLLIEYEEHEGIVLNKRCVSCLKMCSIDNFSNLIGSFLNKNNKCKECEAKRHKQIRRSKGIPDKQPVVVNENGLTSRICSQCKLIKSIKEYGLSSSGYLGHESLCFSCKKEKSEINRRKNGIKPKRIVPVSKDEHGVITHRECCHCLKMLELSKFNKHGGKTSTAYLGIHPYCKECSAEKHLISKYGITMKDKLKLIREQSNQCKICLENFDDNKLRVDHCHKTGKVRAVLCDDCNLALGLVKENKKTLERMIDYLEIHKE